MVIDNTEDKHPKHAPYRGAHKAHLATSRPHDMDTVASTHPQALEAATALTAAVVGHGNQQAIIRAFEGMQELPKAEQVIAKRIALSPGSPVANDVKGILALAGSAPSGGRLTKILTP